MKRFLKISLLIRSIKRKILEGIISEGARDNVVRST